MARRPPRPDKAAYWRAIKRLQTAHLDEWIRYEAQERRGIHEDPPPIVIESSMTIDEWLADVHAHHHGQG